MGVISRYEDKNCSWAVWEITETISDLIHHARDLKYFLSTIDQYGSELRRQQWLAVRVLTDLLRKNATIEYLDSGKPSIYNGYISISHSHNLIAVMESSSSEVGIDLQIKNDKIKRIAPKFLNENESDKYFSNLDQLTAVWCIKEALYKLYGDGSPYFKDDYEVISLQDDHAIASMRYKNDVKEFTVNLRITDSYVVAFVKE